MILLFSLNQHWIDYSVTKQILKTNFMSYKVAAELGLISPLSSLAYENLYCFKVILEVNKILWQSE